LYTGCFPYYIEDKRLTHERLDFARLFGTPFNKRPESVEMIEYRERYEFQSCFPGSFVTLFRYQ
jgi:hypothetical protein